MTDIRILDGGMGRQLARIGAPFRVAAGADAPVSAWIEDAAARLGSIPIARRVHYNALWRDLRARAEVDPCFAGEI